MALLEQLQSASFKGVSFLIDSSSTGGGRKTVTHEYPNRDSRFVEDLGALQETFSIIGIISEPNYIQKRDALILALKTPGRGELVHPFFGSVQVTAKPYTLSENLTDLGIARFSMVFEASEESIFPSASLNNTSQINQLTSQTAASLQSDFASTFKVTKQYPSNFTSAKGILRGVSTALGIDADNILKTTAEISTFTNALLDFSEKTNSNINNPLNLARDFSFLFGDFAVIGRNAAKQLDLLKKVFGYNKDEAPILPTTIPRVERETNRQIVNSAMNVSALIYAYNTVPQLTFTTDQDIEEVQDILDGQFDYVMNNNNVSDDTIQLVKDMRVENKKFLEQEIVNAFKISTIQTQEIPMTILSFQYYGNVNNTEALIELNNEINSSFVSGDVKILTS
jgi:prophage DNA circulation protein